MTTYDKGMKIILSFCKKMCIKKWLIDIWKNYAENEQIRHLDCGTMLAFPQIECDLNI